MTIKFLWPGRTRNRHLRGLQEDYLSRIGKLSSCRLVESREAGGISETQKARILDVEARGLENHLADDYIICLSDQGKEMTSEELARFLEKHGAASRPLTFICGGFLGLSERVLQRAKMRFSLSRLTFSHETARVLLLEQVYRGLTILKGRCYAK